MEKESKLHETTRMILFKIKVKLNDLKVRTIYLCPNGQSYKALKAALYRTFDKKPRNFMRKETKEGETITVVDKNQRRFLNNEINLKLDWDLYPLNQIKHSIYVKFLKSETTEKENYIKTCLKWKGKRLLSNNRSWAISPLNLPKGTVRLILLLFTFIILLGYMYGPIEALNSIQIEAMVILVVVYIPSLFDKVETSDNKSIGGKLFFLGGSSVLGWLVFGEPAISNGEDLTPLMAPLFVLLGIAFRLSIKEMWVHEPRTEIVKSLKKWGDHIFSSIILAYVGVYVVLLFLKFDLDDIWHVFFAIGISFYAAERLFESTEKIKPIYYPLTEETTTSQEPET